MDSGECNLDGWSIVPPRHICSLELLDSCRFSVLPAWVKVDPLLLVDLSLLCINVRGLQQEDLEILRRLPALYCLVLIVCQKDLRTQWGIHNWCLFIPMHGTLLVAGSWRATGVSARSYAKDRTNFF